MKRWELQNKFKVQSSKFKVDELVQVLLENRGIKTKKEIEEFLNPKLEDVTVASVSIDKKQLAKAIRRIKKAIKEQEQIVVYGDYDVDGISGTAILWETLNELGAKVSPYIPHRVDEGYGLSLTGISNVKSQMSNLKLIITVDNGIVANAAVELANKNRIDVIITDHHSLPTGGSKKLPKAYSIVHTTKLCGAGVAYLLAQELKVHCHSGGRRPIESQRHTEGDAIATLQHNTKNVQHDKTNRHLELAALATIADMVPLTASNRTLAKFGLQKLKDTKRVGLIELYKEAGLDPKNIGVYEVGHIIAPRLNAMGRLEFAMDSLRLLCTKDRLRAMVLADKLGRTNKERQGLVEKTALHAKSRIRNQESGIRKLLFIAHESYQQGVIGLVAGKLVEEFYRPSIVVSIGETYCKASARSVNGFNIIDFIRGASEFLVDAGGHPMAAGFTVETVKLSLLQQALEARAKGLLNEETLTRMLRIDCELPLSVIYFNLYQKIQELAPFGIGNPEPTFISRKVMIEDIRLVGVGGKHLKLRLSQQGTLFNAIAFGLGEFSKNLRIGDTIDIAYVIDQDAWPARNRYAQGVAGGNGNQKLQLKVKDIKAVQRVQ